MNFLGLVLPLICGSHGSLTYPVSIGPQLVSGDGAQSDGGSVADSTEQPPPLERTSGIGESRPPSYQSVPSLCSNVCVQ